ncbi:Centromere protein S [Lachnellula cervina]|uniref:Centromere protein S n=1 Tax=Lachnellula cervina TaxID=1316786 RepID=A0A7D8YHD7_9HELO|nr:Centromere protein S [Lachnellula cervina]
MADAMDDDLRERLKASLWFAIGKIVDEETLRLDTAATPQFIGAMTEMVWSQIENVAQDLETFSRHAGRTTVTTDDVLLITRRNEALYGIMRDFVEKEQVAAPKGKSKAVKGKGRAKK